MKTHTHSIFIFLLYLIRTGPVGRQYTGLVLVLLVSLSLHLQSNESEASYNDETFNMTSRNIDNIKHRLSVIALCERFSCSWISQDRVRTVLSHTDRVKCLHVAQLRQKHPLVLQNQNRLSATKRQKHLFIKNQIFWGC